jgi:hypothetical protein
MKADDAERTPMLTIETDKLTGTESGDRAYWTYNGLDCCLTLEIHEVLAGLPTT